MKNGFRVAPWYGVAIALALASAPGRGAETKSPPDHVIDTGGGAWDLTARPMQSLPMDDITVYAFSQSNCWQSDPQLLELAPDLSIRTWARWDREGTKASDYDVQYVSACHAAHIRFIGGTTASVLFADEFSSGDFSQIVTRDAAGRAVTHNDIVRGAYRASLANPEYRAYLEKIGRLQIDAGADGIFFDEVDQGYQGGKYDNNEGFDDYHLADFNSYLLAKYPPGTDFARRFQMTDENLLRRDVPAGDLRRNFNYRRYLVAHGWSDDPLNAGNPLAAEWGRSYDDHPEPGAKTFVSAAEPYRYFGSIVRNLKAYAQEKYGRKLLITANGLLPNVDFQSVGLWDYNHDGDNGTMADYVPVSWGHLKGTVSLQSVFRRFRARSELLAPGVPVVVFLDWPTPTINRYTALPASERRDYWRMYAAEAYANGIFFAFHLKTTTGEPTAEAQGMMPFFKQYSAFYRGHAGLYHHVREYNGDVSVSARRIMTAEWSQPDTRRVLVHLVNHNYDRGFKPQRNVTVTLPLSARPHKVTEASPDLAADRPLNYEFANGKLSVTVPSLQAYSVLVVEM